MKGQLNQNNNHEEAMDKALRSLSEDIDAPAEFKVDLEQMLAAHQARFSSFTSSFKQTLPVIGWAMGLLVLAIFLNWVIRGIVPTPPVPAAELTITPTVEMTSTPESVDEVGTPTGNNGYDWRGAKLYLSQPLPESPAEANVYQLMKDQQITPDEARALASRFGLQGEMYTAYDYVFSVNDYYFTDGKQALQIYSNRRFTYTAELAKTNTVIQLMQIENAETTIHDFLTTRGFDFPFKITPTEFFGGYSLEPLTADGLTIQYESFTFPPMLIKLDENGEVFSLDATLVDYDSVPVGAFGIIPAQEALDNLLNDNEQGGKREFFHSAQNKLPKMWYRAYPDNQTVTIYGYVSSNLSVDSSKPPFITIDGVPAIGNVSGIQQLERSTLIEATGQYRVENGLRQFEVASWTTNIELAYVSGTLRLDADQVILVSDDGSGKEYLLIDPPIDLPVDAKPESQLIVSGALVGEMIFWTNIQFFDDASQMGGGGGGGGLGFYQLNLSGTPIPFPSPTSQPEFNQASAEYIIKEGDTIFAIAQSYGVTPDEIFQANDWLSEEGALIPGKTLIIPGVQSSSAAGQYIVQENDTLAAIALNHGVTVEQLVQANGLPDPDNVYVGQVLLIPGLQSSSEQRVENFRGFLSISIHKSADGSQITSYLVAVSDPDTQTFYELEASNLSEIDPYNGLPIMVSGTIRNEAFIPTLAMDSYEIPFPDLKFQIVKGTQQVQEIDGQLATLFTTEAGQTYVELLANTGQLTDSILGSKGDLVQHEALIVPDETYGSNPVIRVFSSAVAISPKNGQPVDLEITADQIPIYDDAAIPEVPNITPPSVTIDSIELEYFVNNPYYQVNDPNYERRSMYIQPVWHFQGHYEDGSGFDMMIQALKREFLSPQLSPGITPG
jgi:LysM repeat protein